MKIKYFWFINSLIEMSYLFFDVEEIFKTIFIYVAKQLNEY